MKNDRYTHQNERCSSTTLLRCINDCIVDAERSKARKGSASTALPDTIRQLFDRRDNSLDEPLRTGPVGLLPCSCSMLPTRRQGNKVVCGVTSSCCEGKVWPAHPPAAQIGENRAGRASVGCCLYRWNEAEELQSPSRRHSVRNVDYSGRSV